MYMIFFYWKTHDEKRKISTCKETKQKSDNN